DEGSSVRREGELLADQIPQARRAPVLPGRHVPDVDGVRLFLDPSVSPPRSVLTSPRDERVSIRRKGQPLCPDLVTQRTDELSALEVVDADDALLTAGDLSPIR